MKFGAPRNTARPKLRQPLAFEVWKSITSKLTPSDKITVLTNGPVTNLANIILSDNDASSIIKNVYTVGGHITNGSREEGNVFTVLSNRYSEFNIFLDPLAAKTIINSGLDITLVPLEDQRKVTSFSMMLQTLQLNDNTPESLFANRLLSLMHDLQQKSQAYQNLFADYPYFGASPGYISGRTPWCSFLGQKFKLKCNDASTADYVVIDGADKDGQITIDRSHGKLVKILDSFDSQEYYTQFAGLLGDEKQSAVVGSFDEQMKMWTKKRSEYSQ